MSATRIDKGCRPALRSYSGSPADEGTMLPYSSLVRSANAVRHLCCVAFQISQAQAFRCLGATADLGSGKLSASAPSTGPGADQEADQTGPDQTGPHQTGPDHTGPHQPLRRDDGATAGGTVPVEIGMNACQSVIVDLPDLAQRVMRRDAALNVHGAEKRTCRLVRSPHYPPKRYRKRKPLSSNRVRVRIFRQPVRGHL